MVLRLPSCHLNLLSSLFELMRLDLLFFINKHGHKTLKCYSKQHRPKSRETFFFFFGVNKVPRRELFLYFQEFTSVTINTETQSQRCKMLHQLIINHKMVTDEEGYLHTKSWSC